MTKTFDKKHYQQNYWRRRRQASVALSLQEWTIIKKRADDHDRTVGQQILAESQAYLRGEYLPAKTIEDKLAEISFLIRNVANNVNQMARHSNRFRQRLDQKQIFQTLARLETEIDRLVRQAWREPPQTKQV